MRLAFRLRRGRSGCGAPNQAPRGAVPNPKFSSRCLDEKPRLRLQSARFPRYRGFGPGSDLLRFLDGHGHRLFRERFKNLRWPDAQIRCTTSSGQLHLTCDTFAWSVCLDESGETPLADNYFDLLPGIDVTLPWPNDRPGPSLIRAANNTSLGNR